MSAAIETLELSRAEQLVHELTPHRARFQPDPRRWAFRGQGDSRWNLEPTALRASSWCGFARTTAHVDRAREDTDGFNALTQELARLLAAFVEGLEENGLPVPGDSAAMRRLLVPGGEGAFNQDELVPLLSLARHHGLPTPLLDWSWDNRVAAYFAAMDVVNRRDREGRLCIWAFNTAFEKFFRPGSGTVSIVSPSRATNPNLHAQAGLFTMCGGRAGWHELRQYVEEIWVEVIEDGQAPPTPALWAITLPKTEARDLLRLLAHERVDGGRLFPGPDGAVRRVRERLLWQHEND